MPNDIMVSVYCLAYNHEKYIKKALDGFVMQKTSFPFEVIIHDDASTDRTKEIIRDYAEKYDFIIPVLQIENKYSKGEDIISKYISPLTRGKYVAVCEGDDFWTDSDKLQLMVEYMESHPDCSMCCHAYRNIEANTEKFVEEVHTLPKDGNISIEQAICYTNPPQIASQMFKRGIFCDTPKMFQGRGVGDYPIYLYSAISGNMHYIDKVMASHRIMSDNSWSKTIYSVPQKRIKHCNSMISLLEDFDEYTSYRYHVAVQERKDHFRFIIADVSHDYVQLRKTLEYKKQSTKKRLLIFFGCYFPRTAKKIEKCYLRLRTK